METAFKTAAASLPPRDQLRSDVRVASTDPMDALLMIAHQRAAYERRRRWKRGALMLLVAGIAASALAIPHLRERGLAAAHVGTALRAEAGPSALTAPAVVAAPDQRIASAPLSSAPDDPAVRCQSAFMGHQWRAALESCGAVFDAAPSAALAMRIAHAHWAHGDATGAGTWGQRALELGTQDADAYVLIGHSQRAAGDTAAAVAAYRSYLELAPRGWHAARLRTVIRQLARTSAPKPGAAR
jgi:hypothetical protein